MTKKVLTKFGLKSAEHSFENWNQMRVHTSMTSLSDSFGFLDVDFSRGKFDQWNIKRSEEVKIFIEDETLITGYIESIPVEYGKEEFNIQFIGRDKTSDLIDCTYNKSNNEFKKQTRANIIKRLLSPFNLDVVVDSSATSAANVKLDTFKADEGAFIYDLISEICRDAGLLPLTLGDGKLTLMKATTTDRATDPIQYGDNAVWGKRIDNAADRYSDYYIKGCGIGSDSKRLEDFIEPQGHFQDSVVSRYRPITIFSDRATDSGKCNDRAKFEARVRAAYSNAIVYQLPGWKQSDNSIWKKNTIITVYDEILGLSAQELLAAEIDYYYDETDKRGAWTTIVLVDKDAFSGSANDISIKTRFDQ